MPLLLDTQEIRRNFRDWKPIAREEALRLRSTRQVVMILSAHGREKAVPFTEGLRSGAASPGATTRYFLFMGNGIGALRLSWPAAISVPQAPLELEPFEFDVSGLAETREDKTQAEKKFFPIEIQLVDGTGTPFPPTAYRLTLPDGQVKEGTSDDKGFIRYLENTQEGEATVEMEIEKEEGETAAPAGNGAHPIEIKLMDPEGKALTHAGYRITLPDGKPNEGRSDEEGYIRIPDNDAEGEFQLVLTDLAGKEAVA